MQFLIIPLQVRQTIPKSDPLDTSHEESKLMLSITPVADISETKGFRRLLMVWLLPRIQPENVDIDCMSVRFRSD